jgi:hypothetical protein
MDIVRDSFHKQTSGFADTGGEMKLTKNHEI